MYSKSYDEWSIQGNQAIDKGKFPVSKKFIKKLEFVKDKKFFLNNCFISCEKHHNVQTGELVTFCTGEEFKKAVEKIKAHDKC